MTIIYFCIVSQVMAGDFLLKSLHEPKLCRGEQLRQHTIKITMIIVM